MQSGNGFENLFGNVAQRLYVYIMKAANDEKSKRKVRGYKVSDYYYKKAMSRQQKENLPLATLLENVVHGIANGYNIRISSPTRKTSKK